MFGGISSAASSVKLKSVVPQGSVLEPLLSFFIRMKQVSDDSKHVCRTAFGNVSQASHQAWFDVSWFMVLGLYKLVWRLGVQPTLVSSTPKSSLIPDWFSQKYIADPLWFYNKSSPANGWTNQTGLRLDFCNSL